MSAKICLDCDKPLLSDDQKYDNETFSDYKSKYRYGNKDAQYDLNNPKGCILDENDPYFRVKYPLMAKWNPPKWIQVIAPNNTKAVNATLENVKSKYSFNRKSPYNLFNKVLYDEKDPLFSEDFVEKLEEVRNQLFPELATEQELVRSHMKSVRNVWSGLVADDTDDPTTG